MATTPSGERRYWDSCNWISLIAEDEVERADICQHILDDAAAGNGAIVTSTLALAEVVRGKGQPVLPEDQERTIVRFFEHSYLLVEDVTRRVAELARRYAREFGLKPPDAIHFATAVLAGCSVFETWNMNEFGRIGGQAAISIRPPTWTGNLSFDLEH